MRTKKRSVAAAMTLTVVTTVTAMTWTAVSGGSDVAVPAPAQKAGVGETLVLVLAGVVSPAEALTELERVNQAFGDVQGFYVDAADGYEPIGALLQTSPDLVAEPCVGPLGTPASGGSTNMLRNDCPVGEVANVLQPISTTSVRLVDLPQLASSSVCALSGRSCGLDRVRQLLGDDLRLEPGATILGTGFRTKRGAEEFLELARSLGVTNLVTLRVKKRFGGDVGLGQEAAPDGSGPLTRPLVDQERHQR